jgi:hypothetical protein
MIILLFVAFIACEDCDQRTKVFTEHGQINENGYFFVLETYSGINQCTVISNTDFRNLINKQLPCNYTHCQSKSSTPWGCIFGNSQECYNVEHIIPQKHNISELKGCDVNIPSNLIMSYGLWNQQLGNSHYHEKRLIYGDLFDNSYKSIYWCCKNKNPETIPFSDCHNNNFGGGMITLLVIVIIFSLICIYIIKNRS